MQKKRNKGFILAIAGALVIVGLLAWFFILIFEGEKPRIEVSEMPEYLSGRQEIDVVASDRQRGVKHLEVLLEQGGRRISLLEKKFPYKGLLNAEGVHRYEERLSIDPNELGLAQGRLDLRILVRDYSRRRGGDGNRSLLEHKMVVDTIPPAIRAVSRMHNVNLGGACLVVYQTSSDTMESGVFVDDHFFKGFPAGGTAKEGLHVCYIGLPYFAEKDPEIYLWAQDRAENHSRAGFYYHVRKKRFRSERIALTDRFFSRVLPYFSIPSETKSSLEKFLVVNRRVREENNRTLAALKDRSNPEQLWHGTWLRLKNAASMAKYADHRTYYYKGKEVDEQVHLGVDLASLANSEVQAANRGRVTYAGSLGIYGLTVVLDHGQGLASVYGHLSRIDVELGQEVMKGQVIGLTGQTGLAGGDHLHFGMMAGGVFVNPIEWWDPHWIQDNITRKLAMIRE